MGLSLDDWTDCQKKFSLYYMTCCEHGGTFANTVWNDCNYGPGDIFTLGAVQWAGTAAALFLLYIKDVNEEFYEQLPPEWLEYLDAYGWDNQFWNSYYNTVDNYIIWVDVSSQYLDDVKQATLNMWFEGEEGETLKNYYEMETGGRWGYVDTDNIKILLYYMQLMHHRPAYLSEVYQIAGNTTDWEQIANAAMSVIIREEGRNANTEGFYNRYHYYAVTPLEEWDGESCPEGWEDWEDTGGKVDEPGTGTEGPDAGAGTGGTAGRDGITSVMTNNQDLVINYADGSRLLCRQAQGGNVWIPYTSDYTPATGSDSDTGSQSGGTDPDDPVTGGTTSSGEWEHCAEGHALIQSVMGQWSYGSDYHKYNPYHWPLSGTVYNDCSGFVGWTVHELDEELYNTYMSSGGVPYSTQGYQENGSFSDVIQCGYYGSTDFDVSLVKCFDVLLINYLEASNKLKDYTHGGQSHIMFLFPDGDICKGYHISGSDTNHTPGQPWEVENVVTDTLPGCPYWEHRRLRYSNYTEDPGETIPAKALAWAIDIANDDTHGYRHNNERWGPEYDCSSLVFTAFHNAGLDVPVGSDTEWLGDFTTYTMMDYFPQAGCTLVTPTNDMNILNAGDILLYVGNRDDGSGHTVIYAGSGKVVGARADWDGQYGDSQGNEICLHDYYAKASDGWTWDYVLRAPDYV